MRPRINDETAELVDELDRRCKNLPAEERPDTLVRRTEGRGSGSNYFTHDSLIRTALDVMIHRVDVTENVLEMRDIVKDHE